mmetsp:Transcript_24982/g.59454  ORF Transcript_24982/g.59454 Transcript_24982/m.59454 type:complete len:324 (-) Transcript_24982:110-1081(-)
MSAPCAHGQSAHEGFPEARPSSCSAEADPAGGAPMVAERSPDDGGEATEEKPCPVGEGEKPEAPPEVSAGPAPSPMQETCAHDLKTAAPGREEALGGACRAPPGDEPASSGREDSGAFPRKLAEEAEGPEDPQMPSAGCTAVVALVEGRRLWVANAGDSRCVLSRAGVVEPMSRDHKPSDPAELERINKAGGFVCEGRINGSLNLSRALGDLEFKGQDGLRPEEQLVSCVPDVVELELRDGDEFIVLACDGVWDVMSNQEVVAFVRERILSGGDPKTVCEQLCDRCLAPDTNTPERGCDNISAMVVLFKELWGEELRSRAPQP